MTVVLDASALLALLLDESGADLVAAVHGQSLMCAVNVAEVAERLARNATEAAVKLSLAATLPSVIAVDTDLALVAGLMRASTRSVGLSLGDRFCLALGKRLSCPVLTADRAWAEIAAAVGVEVRLIR